MEDLRALANIVSDSVRAIEESLKSRNISLPDLNTPFDPPNEGAAADPAFLKASADIIAAAGTNANALGCEICKPAIGSILSSLYNEHVMQPVHHQNQDTNDRYMANIQRNGALKLENVLVGL